jgi:hypothetical protein
MGKGLTFRNAAWLLILGFLLAAPAFALDTGQVNEIRRAKTASKLLDLADKITKQGASREPLDSQEAAQLAAETAAYLLYIQVKQNDMILESLNRLVNKE